LIIIRLLLLLNVAKGSNSLNLHEKRTILNRVSKLAMVNLTHTLGTSNDRSEATVCLSFRLMDQYHHKRLYDHIRTQMCRTYVCSATTWSYSCPLCRTYSRTSVHVQKTKLRVVGYAHSSGWSVTRLTAYHNSRHVDSTFKRLTTATTHCDLIKFSSTQTGFLSKSWIIITTPSVILIVVAGM
jgi:hypothetical protein